MFLINACVSFTFCANNKIKYFPSVLLSWINVEPKEDKIMYYVYIFFPLALHNPIVGVYFTAFYRALTSSRKRLLDHIQRRATVGRTPLEE